MKEKTDGVLVDPDLFDGPDLTSSSGVYICACVCVCVYIHVYKDAYNTETHTHVIPWIHRHECVFTYLSTRTKITRCRQQ